MSKSSRPDWTNTTLRAAAVEYAFGQIRDHHAAVTDIAKALNCPPGDLAEWLKDPALSPEKGLYRRDVSCTGGKALNSKFTEDEREAEHVEPAKEVSQDPLALLLRDEDETLSLEERQELAESLEAGITLPRSERIALAVLLRGSDLASRREIVRATLDFIVPPDREIKQVWEKREATVTVPLGSVFSYSDAASPLPSRGAIGKRRLEIRDANGKIILVREYARVRRCRPHGKRTKTLHVELHYLKPVENFAREHVLQQFAILSSLVRVDGRNGQEWADLFGIKKGGKQLVSYHKKRLIAKISEKVGFTGARSKPDPRKGTKISQPNQNPSA